MSKCGVKCQNAKTKEKSHIEVSHCLSLAESGHSRISFHTFHLSIQAIRPVTEKEEPKTEEPKVEETAKEEPKALPLGG